jgi:SPASM domain peptide maturase of grasp-with-spasm system
MNTSSETYIKLFESVKPVRGNRRSIICDLQRGNYSYIPNDLYNILEDSICKSKDDLLNSYGAENVSVIKEYIDFLEKNEYVFYCEHSEIKMFPELSLFWDSSSKITNAIVECNNKFDYKNIFTQLENLSCKNVQLISYYDLSIKSWGSILETTKDSKFSNIEIITKWLLSDTIENIINLLNENLRLTSVVLHSANENLTIEQNKSQNGNIYKIKDVLATKLSCGLIHSGYFAVNISHFTESQEYNTCLNRKVSIDVNGEIKNCPSMAKSYGNIKDTTLAEAIEKPGFKDLWDINKDKIHVCKDCEFRYICTDCRAYIENPEDIYSKPLKCGYNPYTAEWEEWSTNPLKQKAIEYYGMQDLVKKDN